MKAKSKRTRRPRVAHPRSKQSTSTDPIFAAIEAHKRAWTEFEKAVDAQSRFEERHQEEYDLQQPEPVVLRGGRVFRERDELAKSIRVQFAEFTQRFSVLPSLSPSPKLHKAFKAAERIVTTDLLAAFDAAQRKRERIRERTGWNKIEAQWQATNAVADKALAKLCGMRPKTAEGLAAQAAYVASIYEEQVQHTWTNEGKRLLSAIANAADRLTGKAVRS